LKKTNEIKIPALYRILPGLGLISMKKKGTGLFYLLAFTAFLTLLVFRLDLVSLSFRSLIAGFALLLLSPDNFTEVFTADILEFWIAACYLIAVPVTLYTMSVRSLRKALKDKGTPPAGELSLRQLSLRSFMRNPIALYASGIIFILYSIAFLAPYLAPYSPYDQQDFLVTAYQPPLTRLDALVLKHQQSLAMPVRKGKGSTVTLTNLLIGDFQKLKTRNKPYTLKFVDSYRLDGNTMIYRQGGRIRNLPLNSLKPVGDDARIRNADGSSFVISRMFVLGTDQYGRDILSRVIYGSRISLSIGFLVVLISVTLGTVIGVSSGYFGSWVDNILMRTVDVLIAFPALFLILIIIATFGNSIYLIVITLSFTGWMGVARIVRGQVLSLKEQEFILAAKSLGLSHLRIIFRHLVPNAMTPVIVAATLRIGSIILTEAGLSFLGLGVQPPTPSWGNIINEGRDSLLNHWWISTFPGIAILSTVVCFNLIGDGVRDALDPRMRG